ncbi:hypothetical protein GNP84_06670 [Aliivibrio fischeri]|uniref:hypothetical protein n=1 Tax=Aliivibrio fischeri TaxID=668 RepID=UPI0012D86E88|nr:hypothetical protein [Aliivibrio fischeri]MUK76589.1 hypothetical protein [Aliivibrio fischeri]
MQYAKIICNKEDNTGALLDASEIYILEVPSSDIIEQEQDDTQFVSKLVYGRYMPQVDMGFPRSEIKRHINDAVNKWLAFISGNTITYLGIEAIELIDVTLTTNCGHCPKPHKSNHVPFAALISCPADFKLNKRGFAKTAFVRWHNWEIVPNLLNRLGLFAFICEERRYQSPPTIDNWTSRIDYRRATKRAQRLS